METPGKVKICAYLMYVGAVLNLCGAFMLLGYMAIAPSMMMAEMGPGTSPAEIEAATTAMQIGFAVGACFVVLIAGLYAYTGYGLMNLKGWAKIVAIILSVISLCSFPIGTAMGGFILYVLLMDEESIQAFNRAA